MATMESPFQSSSNSASSKKRKLGRFVDAATDATLTGLFGKRVEITNHKINKQHCQLPDAHDWFIEQGWKIDKFQILKSELNDIKSKLNDFNLSEWSRHTRRRNKAGNVQWEIRKKIDPELLTQAWCKFYENACSFALVDVEKLTNNRLNTVHMCEAPGGFVSALNHWLKLNAPEVDWSWLATSLNPHYDGNPLTQMIGDDRFIRHTLDNWHFGADNTGNIMKLKNLDALIESGKKSAPIMLVTADGSIDCVDSPAEQENIVSQLHYCQTVAAFSILNEGGNFLLKLFTIFEHQSICLMYLLSCCFDEVHLNKPVTSKEGNSEVYVVCLGFAGYNFIAPYIKILRDNYELSGDTSSTSGIRKAMFRISDIPDLFVQHLYSAGEYFKAHQCEVILNNMRTFGNNTNSSGDEDVYKIKRIVAERFFRRYNLRPLLSESLEIVGKQKLTVTNDVDQYSFNTTSILGTRGPAHLNESYNCRKDRRNNQTPKERLAVIVENLEQIVGQNIAEFIVGHTFKFNDIPDKLWISIGEPYEKIESSKFCTPFAMKMYSTAVDIINEIVRLTTPGESTKSTTIPSMDSLEQFNKENPTENVVNFGGYTSLIPDSHEFISQILDALKSLEKNQSLTFLGYTLLSQLNVGILHVLTRTFDSLELQPSENLGCIIRLKNFTKHEKIHQFLKDIFDALVEAKHNGQAVLSVLRLSTLISDPCLYRHIVEINHWVIRHCVRNFTELK